MKPREATRCALQGALCFKVFRGSLGATSLEILGLIRGFLGRSWGSSRGVSADSRANATRVWRLPRKPRKPRALPGFPWASWKHLRDSWQPLEFVSGLSGAPHRPTEASSKLQFVLAGAIGPTRAPGPWPPRTSPGETMHRRSWLLTDRVTEGAGFCDALGGPGAPRKGPVSRQVGGSASG